MTTLATRISLDELHGFAGTVRTFPVSVRQLLVLAHRTKAPRSVINFYQTFDGDHVFNDKDDLISRTEQVEILRQESDEMPPEEERAPEED